jgi:CheY-like chemotaxis protein
MKKKLSSIMLIDDNAADNRYHQIIINEKGVTDLVEIALDGAQAIKMLQLEKEPPDLIFLDINMPKMNGWEFLDMYKKLGIGTKWKPIVLILTTSANPDDQMRAAEIVQVNGFIVKPLNMNTLHEIIEKHFPEHL